MFESDFGAKDGAVGVSLTEFVEGVVKGQGDKCRAVAMTVVGENMTFTASIGVTGGLGIEPETVLMAGAMRKYLDEELKVASMIADAMERNGELRSSTERKVAPIKGAGDGGNGADEIVKMIDEAFRNRTSI